MKTYSKTMIFMCCLDALYYDGCYSIEYPFSTNEFYKIIGIHDTYTAFVGKDKVKKHARQWISNNIDIK